MSLSAWIISPDDDVVVGIELLFCHMLSNYADKAGSAMVQVDIPVLANNVANITRQI
jgi:hypothetical protein